MIHTLRENETIDELTQIFSCEKSDITDVSGSIAMSPVEGMSVWLSLGGIVSFDEVTLARSDKELFIHPNAKISCIYKPTSNSESFVGADSLLQNASSLYIDAYSLKEEVLELANDYPAINACKIANTSPCFYLSDPDKYAPDNILEQLLVDLSFKEYTRCLVSVDEPKKISSYKKIRESLKGVDIQTDICAPYRVLKEGGIKNEDGRYYYIVERNVLDFESFSSNIMNIAKIYASQNVGCMIHPRAASINKKTGKVSFPDISEISTLLNTIKGKISFDSVSQLAHCTYSSNNEEVSLIFEDFKSLYAKLSFLSDNKINYILTQGEESLTLVKNLFGIIKPV